MSNRGNKICLMRPGHSVVVRDELGGFTFRYESFDDADQSAVVSFKGARVVMFEGDSIEIDETHVTYVRMGDEAREIKFSFRAPMSVHIGNVPRRPGPAEVKA